jgi:hypothetical protein
MAPSKRRSIIGGFTSFGGHAPKESDETFVDGPPPQAKPAFNRLESDTSSQNSSNIQGVFEANTLVIKCKPNTRAGSLKVPGIEIKLESNEIAHRWLAVIRNYMDFNV